MTEAGLVLVLNSGSATVKFAVIDAASGHRVLGGQAEKVGTPEAVLHVQRDGSDPGSEPLTDGSYQAVIARILGDLPGSGPGPALAGAGHRVVHGGARFTASVLVDDEVIAAIRSFSPLAPLHNAANARHGQTTGGRISPDGPVLALVVPTDEELMIARDTARLIVNG